MTKSKFDPTRQELETTSLYVINTSDCEGRYPRGDINFPIRDDSGQDSIAIKIPNTWIPIDLCSFAPKNNIIKNHYFRRLLASGRIGAITETEANKVLEDKEAYEEQVRVLNGMHGSNNATTKLSEKVQIKAVDKKGKPIDPDKSLTSAPSAPPGERTDIHPALMNAIQTNADDTKVRSIILTNKRKLKKRDYDYIIENCNSSSITDLAVSILENL